MAVNYLGGAQLDPGLQVVDGRAYGPGKSGLQALLIDSQTRKNDARRHGLNQGDGRDQRPGDG